MGSVANYGMQTGLLHNLEPMLQTPLVQPMMAVPVHQPVFTQQRTVDVHVPHVVQRAVPKIETQEVVRHVNRVEVQTVEKVVEVPQVQIVDKIEVPQIQEVI